MKDGDEVMLITDRGQTLRTRVDEIRETGRNAQGVKIMTLDPEERIVALERLAESPEDEATGDSVLPPGSGEAGTGGGGGGEIDGTGSVPPDDPSKLN